jgi:hypothetical protein
VLHVEEQVDHVEKMAHVEHEAPKEEQGEEEQGVGQGGGQQQVNYRLLEF